VGIPVLGNGDLWDPIWKRVKNAMILRNRYKQA